MQTCTSRGYVFQMEMIVRARQLGFSIAEVQSLPSANLLPDSLRVKVEFCSGADRYGFSSDAICGHHWRAGKGASRFCLESGVQWWV